MANKTHFENLGINNQLDYGNLVLQLDAKLRILTSLME